MFLKEMAQARELEPIREEVGVVKRSKKAKGEIDSVNKVIGYFIIPLWILGQIATTAFLIVTFVLSKVKKSKGGKPYFKVRSIASV